MRCGHVDQARGHAWGSQVQTGGRARARAVTTRRRAAVLLEHHGDAGWRIGHGSGAGAARGACVANGSGATDKILRVLQIARTTREADQRAQAQCSATAEGPTPPARSFRTARAPRPSLPFGGHRVSRWVRVRLAFLIFLHRASQSNNTTSAHRVQLEVSLELVIGTSRSSGARASEPAKLSSETFARGR